MSEDVVLSWSGGKDSALALWVMREELGVEPTALLTTMTEGEGRVGTHAGPRRAGSAPKPRRRDCHWSRCRSPPQPSNQVYEERIRRCTRHSAPRRVETVAFADLFLADIRAYREERLAKIGAAPRSRSGVVTRRRSRAAFAAAGFGANGGPVSTPSSSTRHGKKPLRTLPPLMLILARPRDGSSNLPSSPSRLHPIDRLVNPPRPRPKSTRPDRTTGPGRVTPPQPLACSP